MIRKTAAFCAAPLPVKALQNASRQPLILPFYHSVSDERLPHLAHVLQIRTTKAFRADLDFLLRHFEPVGATDLINSAAGIIPLRKPSFHLTFDDGLKEIYTVAAPILREKGVPATFFLNTGFIGNRNIFYRFAISLLLERTGEISKGTACAITALLDRHHIRTGDLRSRLLSISWAGRDIPEKVASLMDFSIRDYIARHPIYLDEAEIRQLLAQGFTIGAHSHDHPWFCKIPPEEQLRQVKQSAQILQEKFGVTSHLFSFPFSDEGVPRQYFDALYPPRGEVELSFGISGMKEEEQPRHLHRIPMETGIASGARLIKGEYLYYIMKMALNKNRITRK